ncbi:MAG: methionyl-tRNA formyltransferase [Spirochaetes bacterium]|nr:methionyl-tRNA formyltransferase [Spirochaetota bacterium]
MKIIFLTSSDISIKTFYELKKKHEITAVITSPDKAKGRSKELIPADIAVICEKENILLYKTDSIDNKTVEELKQKNSDIFITFAFGVILKKEFFEVSRYGGINIHPSLLPDLRGPSPIQTAILNGYTKSGITIQKMALKVDSGDILLQIPFDIEDYDDAESIEKKVSKISADSINDVLEKIEKGSIKSIPQNNEKVTYCRLIKKEFGEIDWNDTNINIRNKIRAFVKWPIAFSYIDKQRINIYKANIAEIDNIEENEKNGKILFADKNNGIIVKTGLGLLKLEVLQKQGKNILQWKDFLNGFRDLNNKYFNSGASQ